jgi:NagD protein
MFIKARQHLGVSVDQVVMIGDTMETDIRGSIEVGMQSYLVLTGSTELDDLVNYVYQPTRVMNSVADLVEEIRTGKPADRLNSPVFSKVPALMNKVKIGAKHQTDIVGSQRVRPRPAMTK